MLESLVVPPADPILALGGAVRSDPRPDKIDLGIGVYRDAGGRTPIMAAVRDAERRLLNTRETKTYVGGRGDLQFVADIARLVFGEPAFERLGGVQATGGTGALRLLAGLIARADRDSTVWLPEPTWANHLTIFAEAGLRTAAYPYCEAADTAVRIAQMLATLETIPSGDVVLLHGCCHNPCGIDLAAEDWDAVAYVMERRGLIPLFDLAYQGFGRGLDEDAKGVRKLAACLPELMVAFSCSKNFGLYSERVGCALALAQTDKGAKLAAEHMALVARPLYSMPPDHGSAIVRAILEDDALNAAWRQELEAVRQSIVSKRRQLATAFRNVTGTTDFDFLFHGTGMFSRLPLAPDMVMALRRDHGIYIVEDGRMNVAGLPSQRVGDFVRAVVVAARR